MTTHVIDQEARDLANRAISLIEGHERVCTERARESSTWRIAANDKLNSIELAITEKLTSMGNDIKGVYNRLWVAAGALLTTLLTIIGYLIVHKGL